MDPRQRYDGLAQALSNEPGVAYAPDGPGSARKFGGSALKTGGKIFAMLSNDRLVVKLPRARVDALVASGDGERLSSGQGRQMKEWLSLDPASTQDWRTLGREALAFVGDGG